MTSSDRQPTTVEQVMLADLRADDVVWDDGAFSVVREVGTYPDRWAPEDSGHSYVGYIVHRPHGESGRMVRHTGVSTNPILRVVQP